MWINRKWTCTIEKCSQERETEEETIIQFYCHLQLHKHVIDTGRGCGNQHYNLPLLADIDCDSCLDM